MLQEGQQEDLVALLSDLHPNDAASILSGLEPDEITAITALLPVGLERDIFEYLDSEVQESIIAGAGRERLVRLIQAMSSDERAAFMERLDERIRDQVFPLLNRAVREDLIRREQYEPGQVGAILSTEYCALGADLTVVRAIEEVRRQAPDKETIYVCYVVDGQGRLRGLVSLRDLLVARAHLTVGEVMRTDVAMVEVTADQAVAARMIRDYDLIAIPVVDHDQRLVGILTHDDAADILEAEETEDIQMMAGITVDEEAGSYAAEGVLSHFRRRVPWVVALAVMFLGTAAVIQHYEALVTGTLLAFLPMVMSTGGNVGAQTSTVVIRGLAVGQIDTRAILGVIWKELRISGCMAVVLGIVVFVEVALIGSHDGSTTMAGVALAISAALAVQIVAAALYGATIPISLSAFGMDPALVANPALTTLCDLSGALIYFLTISLLL
jgi:magnesium transporter